MAETSARLRVRSNEPEGGMLACARWTMTPGESVRASRAGPGGPRRMTTSSEARRVLEDATEDAYVFSTHDHLRPMDGHPRPMSLVDLLKDSYAALAFRDADGSPHGMGHDEPPRRRPGWQDVAPVLSRMRSTSASASSRARSWSSYGSERRHLERSLVRGAGAGPSPTATTMQAGCRRRSTARRVVGVIWDNFWKPGEWRVPDDRFAPSMRINSSVAAVDAEAQRLRGLQRHP